MTKNLNRLKNALTTVEDFFFLADSHRLLTRDRANENATLRQALSTSLVDLLFQGRAFLQAARGIDWMYDQFRNRAGLFEPDASANPNDQKSTSDINHTGWSPRLEAMLFLGLLPFPGQWKWLDTLIKEFPSHPEVTLFLKNETEIIIKKLAKKNIEKLKLRNFCQVLKAPGTGGEKGVLRIFSRPYIFYACPELPRMISKDYFLYVEPAAGINFRHAWMRAYSHFDDPVLFGAGSKEDRRFLASQPNILTTPLAHGDYLEPDDIYIEPAIKTDLEDSGIQKYDIIFNGDFDEMDRKRHSLMLELMTHPLLKDITVLFLGLGSEEKIKAFKTQIKNLGLDHRTAIVANIMRREVPAYLSKCSAGVHLALMENGGRVIYEYFKAGLPCVMSAVTAGMNPDIINPRTGILASEENLAQAISRLLKNRRQYDPYAWFNEQSGSKNSTRALNALLKDIFHDLGYTWTSDIVELTGSGPGRYASDADRERFSPQFKDLEHRMLKPLKQHIQAML